MGVGWELGRLDIDPCVRSLLAIQPNYRVSSIHVLHLFLLHATLKHLLCLNPWQCLASLCEVCLLLRNVRASCYRLHRIEQANRFLKILGLMLGGISKYHSY